MGTRWVNGSYQLSLLSCAGDVSFSVLNLFLAGRAASHLHNGTYYKDNEDNTVRVTWITWVFFQTLHTRFIGGVWSFCHLWRRVSSIQLINVRFKWRLWHKFHRFEHRTYENWPLTHRLCVCQQLIRKPFDRLTCSKYIRALIGHFGWNFYALNCSLSSYEFFFFKYSFLKCTNNCRLPRSLEYKFDRLSAYWSGCGMKKKRQPTN